MPSIFLTLADWLLAFWVLLGSAFCLLAALGMLRFTDFFMRLHASGNVCTLGVWSLLVAGMAASAATGHWHLAELLVMLALLLAAPISAQALAQAGLHHGTPSRAPLPPAETSTTPPPPCGH